MYMSIYIYTRIHKYILSSSINISSFIYINMCRSEGKTKILSLSCLFSFLLQAPSLWDTLIYSYEFHADFGVWVLRCFNWGTFFRWKSVSKNQTVLPLIHQITLCIFTLYTQNITPWTHFHSFPFRNFPESPLLSPWHHWWALLLDHSHDPRSAELDPNGWELRCQNSRSLKSTSCTPHSKKVSVWPVWLYDIFG